MSKQHQHSEHGHHGKHHPPKKRIHHQWWFWVVVVLMLAGMFMYVASFDEALAPGPQEGDEVPAAAE
jgi:hypothetical protein